MPKPQIRGGKLTITIPEEIRGEIDLHDGDQVEVSTEDKPDRSDAQS